MKWTTTKPTEPGWYFTKYVAWDCHFVWLAKHNDDGELVWDDADDPPPPVATFQDKPNDLEMVYAGPIPEPEE